ncbi:toll-like receptor 4 [Saccostrea cucullata]|uniref:toll-like receptor 4 n=1 Tax=Saccostrea cuccullata TaxID=36930 RepID=UPI002ED07B70
MLCSLNVYGIMICILLSITFSRSYLCDLGSVNCTCQDLKNQTKVDCSHRGLYKIPHFYENSTWIDLSDNFIEKIENNFPKNVEFINLSRNKLKWLSNISFHGLEKLKTLNLEYNCINISWFYKGIFSDLKSLKEISLKGNINPVKNILIRDDAFSDLKELNILKMDGPRGIRFGEGFMNLTKLNILDLSGITGNCSFRVLPKDLFRHLPHITYIDVSACEILDIEDGAFGNLSSLQHLDVSHNKGIGFASLPNITKNLNHTDIQILRLNGINCLTGIGTKVLTHHLINLQETNLTEIYIEKNRLEQLEAGALRVLPGSLTTLSMGENKLTQGKYILDYFSMDSLRILNLSVQLRPAPYPISIFENCQEKRDDCEFPFAGKYSERNTRYQNIGSIVESIFRTNDNGLVTIDFPESIEVIYANSSRLYTAIPEFGINSKSFREFYLQDNFFFSWLGPVHGIQNLTILDLSNNFCSFISKSFFRYATGVEILNLSNNDIGKHFVDDIEGKILENLLSVRELDLSYDNINVLPRLMFKNLQNLQVLNLNGNLLSEWRVKMDHMRNLKDINLAKNRLTTIDVIQQRSFETLFSTSNVTVDISDNKLLCSCENLQFLSWITTYRMHFKQFELYQCSLASSKKFNFSEAVSSLVTLRENCRSLLVIYILTSVSIAFLISVVLGVTMVKNKWKILYLIFRAKKVFKKCGTSAMQVETTTYDFHAYISYYEDEKHEMYQFATGDIVEHIETQLNIKLFIPGRNDAGLGGQNKYNIIIENMEKSKRVICLVTKEYLISEMWKYDLKVAMDIGIERGYPDEECGYDQFWEEFKQIFEQDISETRQDVTSEIELENHSDTVQLLTTETE